MDFRARFAPSPTGQVHIGNIRTAIFNWLATRHCKGTFLLRVEDTDLERSTQEAIDKLLECMDWLGLDYDEEIMYQTKQSDKHKESAQKLIDSGKAYYLNPGEEHSPVLFKLPYDCDSMPFVRETGAAEIVLEPGSEVALNLAGVTFHTLSSKGKSVENMASLAGFKNLKIIHCNGKDVFDSMNAMTEAREYALLNRNPVIIHANCVRIGSHSNSDKDTLYRDENELAYVKEADPLLKFRRMLLRYKRLTEEELKEIEEKAKKDLAAANRKALTAPDPDPKSIFNYVLPEPYEPEKYKDGTHRETEGEKKFFVTAINETLKAEFRHNPNTFIWGQDVANRDKGGVFNVTKGMQQEFGEARVFSAPIAEDYIVGTANGMSRFDPKIRVVIEGAEFADYFWPAVEQYVECTHEYWRSNGQFVPNVTLRLASGGYIGGGLYHSQNLEGALATLPGARIVCPSFADDAAGLLRTSIRSRGFTLFIEPKALYNSVEAATIVPDDFEVPFGKARIRREGSDLSIITYGNTTHFCLNVAERLEKEGGWSVEVIDIRSLIPLDKETIYESVKKTSKALIVHEDKVFGGFGGEIAASIGTDLFRYLDAPVQRVGSTFTPVGFNPILERAILPGADRIYEAAKKLLEY